jgi:hypothetical protein
MDQGVNTSGLPQVVDTGQADAGQIDSGQIDSGQVDFGPEDSAPRASGHRLGLGALLIGIAVATVAIPPLVAPRHKSAPAPVASIPPPAQLFPAATVTAPPPASDSTSAKACVPATTGGTVKVTTTPSCAIYTASMGNGWSVAGDGLKVLPGETVPDTKEPAMRVERSRPAIAHTALTITARRAVAIKPGDQLSLRVWGGRDFGTVLKLSVAPAGTGSVTLTAPADKWTAYTIKLSELTHGTGLTRIQLVVATDEVPNVNRFFLDDIALR